jgi:hypothetical protein
MVNLRLWHASRDPYHCAFRLLRLMTAKNAVMEVERFRVLDMFLLYPSLLHKSSMPREVRAEFMKLKISTLDRTFLQLPSAASIFQDLRLYQNSAIAQLAARGIVDADALKRRSLAVIEQNVPSEMMGRARTRNTEGEGLASFLVGPFSNIPLRGTESIYRKAGLPSRGIPA